MVVISKLNGSLKNSTQRTRADFLRVQQYKKRGLSSVVERYFRRNEGSTDYATIPEVTLAGDFVIEFDLIVDDVNSVQWIYSDWNDLSDSRSIAIRIASGNIQTFTSGDGIATIAGPVVAISAGVLSSVKLVKTGSIASISINGEAEVFGSAAPVVFSSGDSPRIYSKSTGSEFLTGILANLKIYDNGTLTRNMPLDDNSDDLRELVSGQNGTVVNGNASDWGLFQQQPNGDWKGQDLDVPPWDSVDQLLVSA